MSQAWLVQRERGTLAALRLITWITQRIGYRAARVLLAPICLYFIVFSGPARRASRDYLRRVLPHAPTAGDVYRHYHTFATSILDRVLLLTDQVDRFELSLHGADVFEQELRAGRGVLLLGSHLGSFEFCRAAGHRYAGLAVNVVMHEANAGKIVAWMRETAPERAPRVIVPGRPETMLEIRDALQRGEVVAMLGDRPIGRSHTIEVDFLGAPAQFPSGPLRLARALKVPVLLFFGLHRAPLRYDLHFEALPTTSGDGEALDLEALVRRYVARLESYTRSAPYNWFNFYDYWEHG